MLGAAGITVDVAAIFEATDLIMARKGKPSRAKVVYVVGAGFSAGLGYPLTSDLLIRLWERIENALKKPLERVIRFHHPGFNPKRFSSFPNVEQLLSETLVNEEPFDASRQYEVFAPVEI